MKKQFLEKMKNVSRIWWILLFIIAVGIFLRTYHFSDWLRFNADQGRDSELVSAVVDGSQPWPQLGPKAGGTEFKLGSAFYDLEIVSAEIFGNTPDKMAYPDLFTGILCIPLLFFFLRKYFDKNTALAMSAIFAVSNYAIRYARFAWNPNSTPFWTMLALYALAEVISQKQKRKYAWSAVAGVTIGIGVQLHTTLLLFLPLTTIAVFGYLALKNKQVLKYFFVILAVALFLNTPQLVHEYQHNGENIKAFFGGVKSKSAVESSLFDNTVHGTSCWIQGNLDIISGYEISDKCSFSPGANMGDTVAFLLGMIFVAGGTILGIQYLQKETDADRKSFLGLIWVFVGISFVIFLKLAYELSVRFYLILIFLPFLLLGFWIKFFREKYAAYGRQILLIPMILLVATNLFFVETYFSGLANYAKPGGGDINITILSEAQQYAQFIAANSAGSNALLDGDQKFLFKAIKPIKYLVEKSNINLSQVNTKNPPQSPYFYIGSSKDVAKMQSDPSVKIFASKTYGSFTIVLKKDNANL